MRLVRMVHLLHMVHVINMVHLVHTLHVVHMVHMVHVAQMVSIGHLMHMVWVFHLVYMVYSVCVSSNTYGLPNVRDLRSVFGACCSRGSYSPHRVCGTYTAVHMVRVIHVVNMAHNVCVSPSEFD